METAISSTRCLSPWVPCHDVLESLVDEGNDLMVAYRHVPGVAGTLDLLGDRPRYEALLEEAGITWSSCSLPDSITRLNAALAGRYRIERELGEGGMPTVYLADEGL